jgi:lipopolysaccharide export system protein LptA
MSSPKQLLFRCAALVFRCAALGQRLLATMGTLASLALFAASASALPEDQQQPIHVTADSAVQENDKVTYRGNVVIVQGSIKIDADQVLIYHDKGKLQRAVATGKPVHFQQQPDTNGGLMTGHAGTVIYYNTDQRVELLQDALVDRDKSTLKGQRIEYLLATKILKAEGAAANNQSGRVEMVLQPNQTDNKAAPAGSTSGAAPATPATPPATSTPAAPAPAVGAPASPAEKR